MCPNDGSERVDKENPEVELSLISKPMTPPVGNELNDLADEDDGSGECMDDEVGIMCVC